MIKKVFVGLLCCIVLYVILAHWRNPGPYVFLQPKNEEAWHHFIHDDSSCKHQKIQSMGNQFDVFYIEIVDSKKANPHFPAISIEACNECSAWLHIVKTDCKQNSKWHHFIDTWSEGYPFYTRGKVFYDNPFWKYGLFSKELSFWVGHAYAILIDEEHKTIKCLGGISWGYRLPWWSLRPIMILPLPLNQVDWQADWEFFETVFLDYKNM